MYKYVYIFIFKYTYIFTYICIYLYIYIFTNICIYMHISPSRSKCHTLNVALSFPHTLPHAVLLPVLVIKFVFVCVRGIYYDCVSVYWCVCKCV